MKISPHLSYSEVIRSEIAKRNGLKNIPNKEQLENIRLWAINIFEPLRAAVKTPIFCTSVFRTPELCKLIPGSSPNSQHTAINGAAGDLDNDGFPLWAPNYVIFEAAKLLDFDQLIWEFGDDFSPDWVHISYHKDHNRHEILRSIRTPKKIEYIKI